jgi:hypothetical protein
MPPPAEDGTSQPAVPLTASGALFQRATCPKCATDRDAPDCRFCGVCGYDFVTGQSGDIVQPANPPAGRARLGRAPSAPSPSATTAPHIDIEITFDESNPEAPKGRSARKFSLYDDESLIGRKSTSVPQTVGLEGDEGVSRRHLLILRQGDGSYVARLFANTNGAKLNSAEMTAGVEEPLSEGDRIALGVFTVIRVNVIRR